MFDFADVMIMGFLTAKVCERIDAAGEVEPVVVEPVVRQTVPQVNIGAVLKALPVEFLRGVKGAFFGC